MNKLFFAFAFFFCAVAVNAQTNTDAPKDADKKTSFYIDEEGGVVETDKPIMTFDQEFHDFKEIQEGEKYTHTFSFENTGTAPLIIQGVKASCGCTTPEWPKDPVLPGEAAVITATYNSKNRPGPFNKAITITSNAITPTKRLFIKGKVIKSEAQTVPVKQKSIIEQN